MESRKSIQFNLSGQDGNILRLICNCSSIFYNVSSMFDLPPTPVVKPVSVAWYDVAGTGCLEYCVPGG